MRTVDKEKDEYAPKQGFVLTHFLTVADVNRSAEFYTRIFGGKIIRTGEPRIIQIANSWIALNVGAAQLMISQLSLSRHPRDQMKLAIL